MSKMTALFITCALTLSAGSALAAVVVDLEGAVPGKWTMDLDAAKKVAAEKKLPILLDFSGSDWCGWCKVMEENVFTKPEWAAYAKDNLVMVLVDFPTDKSLVPEKYVARNEALQAQYGIEGFPTFVVLDDDGTTELGRLGSGRDKTPASFEGELTALFRNRPAVLAQYAASLSSEDKAAFEALTAKIAEQEQAIAKEEAALAAATENIETLSVSLGTLQEQLQEFRVKQLSEAQQAEFASLKEQFEVKREELMTWIGTQPEQNEENTAKFRAMQQGLQDIALKLEAY